jgi:transposase
LVEREGQLPLWWHAYPGNLHDSKLFAAVISEMFSVVSSLPSTKRRLTLVMDKGMNAEANFRVIDEHPLVHFVTTHSLWHSSELASVPLSKYSPLGTAANKQLEREGEGGERLRAHRTTGEYWGQERTVVLTWNPATARKQAYVFEEKLLEIREELLSVRARVREGAPHWRDAGRIRERYLALCERLHVSSSLYELTFEEKGSGLKMEFRKNQYEVTKRAALFGKNMIVTDNSDWTTEDIAQASLDRWGVEDCFRASKDSDLIGVQPLRHFTDSKIRCHLFCCVAALTYARMLEKRLADAGVKRTATDVMEDLGHLHSVLTIAAGGRKPTRRLEEPTKTQAEALKALGYLVGKGGVLQLLGS